MWHLPVTMHQRSIGHMMSPNRAVYRSVSTLDRTRKLWPPWLARHSLRRPRAAACTWQVDAADRPSRTAQSTATTRSPATWRIRCRRIVRTSPAWCAKRIATTSDRPRLGIPPPVSASLFHMLPNTNHLHNTQLLSNIRITHIETYKWKNYLPCHSRPRAIRGEETASSVSHWLRKDEVQHPADRSSCSISHRSATSSPPRRTLPHDFAFELSCC